MRAREVDAVVLGEHGHLERLPVVERPHRRRGGTRTARPPGDDPVEVQKRITEAVGYSKISIIGGIGASQQDIGAVTARIAEAIVRDEHAILPVAAHREEYGTTISLPSLIGRGGVERVVCPELTTKNPGLKESAAVLRDAASKALDSIAWSQATTIKLITTIRIASPTRGMTFSRRITRSRSTSSSVTIGSSFRSARK